jgi:hypothetical protein
MYVLKEVERKDVVLRQKYLIVLPDCKHETWWSTANLMQDADGQPYWLHGQNRTSDLSDIQIYTVEYRHQPEKPLPPKIQVMKEGLSPFSQ